MTGSGQTKVVRLPRQSLYSKTTVVGIAGPHKSEW